MAPTDSNVDVGRIVYYETVPKTASPDRGNALP